MTKTAHPRSGQNKGGFTLIEMILTVILVGMLLLMGGSLFTQILVFIQTIRVNQEMKTEARDSLDTMVQFLRQAKSNTVLLDRFSTNEPIYSRIAFNRADGTATGTSYSFYLQQATPGDFNITMQVGSQAPHVIAHHAIDLKFFYPDGRDRTVMGIEFVLQRAVTTKRKVTVEKSVANVVLLSDQGQR